MCSKKSYQEKVAQMIFCIVTVGDCFHIYEFHLTSVRQVWAQVGKIANSDGSWKMAAGFKDVLNETR